MILSRMQESHLPSVLASTSILNPKGDTETKSLDTPLMLTSLIDGFAILVIYLLMNFSASGDILIMQKGMTLPAAATGAELERTFIVRVQDGRYFVEQNEVEEGALVAKLLELREEFNKMRPNEEFPGTLIVQADRGTAYKQLNSVVLAGAHTGFSEIKFAVMSSK